MRYAPLLVAAYESHGTLPVQRSESCKVLVFDLRSHDGHVDGEDVLPRAKIDQVLERISADLLRSDVIGIDVQQLSFPFMRKAMRPPVRRALDRVSPVWDGAEQEQKRRGGCGTS